MTFLFEHFSKYSSTLANDYANVLHCSRAALCDSSPWPPKDICCYWLPGLGRWIREGLGFLIEMMASHFPKRKLKPESESKSVDGEEVGIKVG
jgi:hypothetical protein